MKKTFKSLMLTGAALATPAIALASTVSCGSGIGSQKTDLSIMIDEQEMKLYKPIIDQFTKETGKTVKMVLQDAQTVLTDLQANKISSTMPDIILSGDTGALAREKLNSTTTLRTIFKDESYVNAELSEAQFEKGATDDLKLYEALAAKYDMNIFKSVASWTKPISDAATAKEFLDKPINGLPVGVTGWGMWIRENRLKGFDKEHHTFKDAEIAPIVKYIGEDAKDHIIPNANGTELNEFLTAYGKKVYAADAGYIAAKTDAAKLAYVKSKVFFEEAPTTTYKLPTGPNVVGTGTFGTANDGIGYFKGTAEGIQAFVAASQWTGFANANLTSGPAKGWYSLGATGQFQRENAAMYNAQLDGATALWDGYIQRTVLAEQFDANGIPSNAAAVTAEKEWKNATLETLFKSTGDSVNDIAKKWWLVDIAYSGKSLSTNEQFNGGNDPATGFWFPQKKENVSKLPTALVKGQQWQSWPLAPAMNDEKQVEAVKDVKTIAIPFKTPGLQGYAFSSQLATKSADIQIAAHKLFRMLFSHKALNIVAGKLQSVMLNEHLNSISQDITSNDPTNKAYLARGLFTDVALAGVTGVTTATDLYTGGSLGYSTLEKYDNPDKGHVDFFKNLTPITQSIRDMDNADITTYNAWRTKYLDKTVKPVVDGAALDL